MSAVYSHIWRSDEYDYPCNPTGREWPDPDGRIYVEIIYEDGRTGVPKEQLVSSASGKAEQAKAAVKTPHPLPAAYFTLITSTTPKRVGKSFSLDATGKLKKDRARAAIVAGKATTLEATPENLVTTLKRTTKSENQVIALDSFIGAVPGAPAEIGIVIEDELKRLKEGEIGAPGAGEPGYFTVNGKIVSARLKRLMQSSGWILIDADTPEGMPPQWARLSLVERLKLLEAILPGISTCLRIEYRGSSARVVNGSGGENPGPTHALIQISDPLLLDDLRRYVQVQSVLHDLSFKSPRHSDREPGKIVGHADLTLIDWSVWVFGRLVFNPLPDVAKASGYRVIEADPRIVNPNGGVLDISRITPPSADQARVYGQKTGRALSFDTGARGGFSVREDGHLRLDTEIESGGAVKPLADWLVEMLDADIVKLRCEAPFRASESEAALIRITETGDVFVFDAGTSISSYLAPLPQTAEEARETAATLDECEMMEAVIRARERRTQRRAEAAFRDPPTEGEEEATAEASAAGNTESVGPVDLWPSAGTPVLPEGLLPKRIETFARAAAIVTGADPGGFAMAALAVAAASIDDAIKLLVMPYSDWLEAARVWMALVGEPSTKKTPILNTTCKALREEDYRLHRDYCAQMAFWDALSKQQKQTEPAPVEKRLILGDTTSEGAQEVLKTETRGVMGLYDELGGWFGQMERYTAQTGRGAERGFWLQAYNGGGFRVDRVRRGSLYLSNLSVTLLGGVQPDLIRQVSDVPSDDGLIQRLTPIMLRPGSPAGHDQEAAEAMRDFDLLVPQLLALKRPESAWRLKFDDRAQAIQAEIEIEHDRLARGLEGFNKKLSTAFGKQTGLFARFCVIWHCVDHVGQGVLPKIVTGDTARRVATFMREFTRPHLFDFYNGVLKLPAEHERLIAIAGYILARKLKTIANRQVQAAVRDMRKLTSKDITPVLEQLEALGWLARGDPLRAERRRRGRSIRPSIRILLNEERGRESGARRFAKRSPKSPP